VVNRRTDNTMAKRKEQKDQQGSTKHYTGNKRSSNTMKRTPLRSGCELRCSETVNSSCSTSDTRRVTLITNPVSSHE